MNCNDPVGSTPPDVVVLPEDVLVEPKTVEKMQHELNHLNHQWGTEKNRLSQRRQHFVAAVIVTVFSCLLITWWNIPLGILVIIFGLVLLGVFNHEYITEYSREVNAIERSIDCFGDVSASDLAELYVISQECPEIMFYLQRVFAQGRNLSKREDRWLRQVKVDIDTHRNYAKARKHFGIKPDFRSITQC